MAVTTNNLGQADLTWFRGLDSIEVRHVGFKPLWVSWDQLAEDDFLLILTPVTISLDQVVISARRSAVSSKDLAGKITRLSGKEVALQMPQTSADLLGASDEVYIQKSQQGGGSPMIRGFSANRLLYSIDGVRMNTAIFRSGNLQNVISIDPFSVQSAEVIFGPGSMMYGSDAIGGVMHFLTLSPGFSNKNTSVAGAKAIFRYSTANNEITAHIDASVARKKWALLTSFTRNHFGDLRMGSYGPDDYLRPWYVSRGDSSDIVRDNDDPEVQVPSGFDMTHFMQKIRYKASDDLVIDYGFHYSTTTDYDRYDRLLRTKNGLPRSAEWYYGPQEWMMHHLSLSAQKASPVYDRMKFHAALQRFAESRHDRDFNSNERNHRYEQVWAGSANLDMEKQVGRWGLNYGLEWVLNDVQSKGESEDILSGNKIAGPARYPDSKWTSAGAYLTSRYRLSPSFSAEGGFRYNYFELQADFTDNLVFYPFPFTETTTRNDAFTGSLGLVFTPDETWVMSLNLASGFRAPNVDDIGKVFDSEPGSVVVPNPGLNPEYVYNIDFDLAHIVSDKLKIDADLFYSWLDDVMVRADYTLNGQDSIIYDGELSRVQAVQNFASARVWGFLAEIEWAVNSHLTLSTVYNFQKGTDIDQEGTQTPGRHAAPPFGVTRLTGTWQKLKAQLYAVYTAAKKYEDLPPGEHRKDYMYALDENGHPWSPSWYTLNLKAVYNLNKFLTLGLGLENITDRRYRPYSSGISAPGRNFIFTISGQL
ncbi:MAG: TonB-dependent receptor [Bacteroidales bacterium]